MCRLWSHLLVTRVPCHLGMQWNDESIQQRSLGAQGEHLRGCPSSAAGAAERCTERLPGHRMNCHTCLMHECMVNGLGSARRALKWRP